VPSFPGTGPIRTGGLFGQQAGPNDEARPVVVYFLDPKSVAFPFHNGRGDFRNVRDIGQDSHVKAARDDKIASKQDPVVMHLCNSGALGGIRTPSTVDAEG